jgi:hypothetical protein
MNDSATGSGKIPMQVTRAEAFRDLNEHCRLDIRLEDAIRIAGARFAGAGTAPVQSGVTSISCRANVIVLAFLTAKVPV